MIKLISGKNKCYDDDDERCNTKVTYDKYN